MTGERNSDASDADASLGDESADEGRSANPPADTGAGAGPATGSGPSDRGNLTWT
jgi:hypothetical protein